MHELTDIERTLELYLTSTPTRFWWIRDQICWEEEEKTRAKLSPRDKQRRISACFYGENNYSQWGGEKKQGNLHFRRWKYFSTHNNIKGKEENDEEQAISSHQYSLTDFLKVWRDENFIFHFNHSKLNINQWDLPIFSFFFCNVSRSLKFVKERDNQEKISISFLNE